MSFHIESYPPREAGLLREAPQDIGPLMKEIMVDTEKECVDEVKNALYKHFWPAISRGITAGFPQWYKDKVAASMFTGDKSLDSEGEAVAHDIAAPTFAEGAEA